MAAVMRFPEKNAAKQKTRRSLMGRRRVRTLLFWQI
jgi:hypothetical protein